MRRTLAIVAAASAIAVAGTAGAADPALERAASRRGQEVLRAVRADLDSDGRSEVLAAVLADQGVALTVWRREPEKPYELVFISRQFDGEVVLRLQAVQLAADPAPEVVFEVREVTPDETSRHLVISRFVRDALVPIFEASFPVGDLDPVAEGDAQLAFGESSAGYRLVDIGRDGKVEIAVRRDVESISAPRADRSSLRVVVGARETIFRFDPKVGAAGEYVAGRERFFPYVREVPPTKTGGSSQALPPELEVKFGRAAVADGMDQVFSNITDNGEGAQKAGGTEMSGEAPKAEPDAGEAKSGTAGDNETEAEQLVMQRDPAPMAKWAADGDLDTSWCEGMEGDGQGQWWEADFGKARTLRMARLIFGDVRTRKTWSRSNEVVGVSLLFSSGDRITFDRRDPTFSNGPIAAFKDTPMPGDRPGAQTLVFFSKPIKAKWVRVELGNVRQRGHDNASCLTEAVFYQSRD